MVNKILFITLTNIGDCILTLPALDFLCEKFPQAAVTVVCGPRAKELFQNNPRIENLIVYQKRCGIKENIRLFMQLKKEGFDAVIDLRNTLFGALLPVKYKISPFSRIPAGIRHMSKRHLYRVQSLRVKGQRSKAEGQRSKLNGQRPETEKISLKIKPEDKEYIKKIFNDNNISESDKIIVVAPGARSHIKRWEKEKFAEVCSQLLLCNYRIILAGDSADLPITEFIAGECNGKAINLCAKTSIAQLAALLENSSLLVTNDSAVLHLGSYLNTPVAAVFGPTNDEKYGPWPETSAVVKRELFCRPCEKAQCRFGTLECMRLVKPGDVLARAQDILSKGRRWKVEGGRGEFKRILVARTDRIGDVLLSTPVIRALREAYPDAYIAMMVSPYAREVAEGNPWLDEVIIYDKEAKHKGFFSAMRFSRRLKRKKFDLALILHPTNRAHLAAFFAGIRRRVGYNRKLGFLLTDRIKHAKHFGERHESDYNFDLLRYLGIQPQHKDLFMPINPQSELWADEVLAQNKIGPGSRLAAIHPGASCPSKIWPLERFAEVADNLAEKYKFRVLILAGPKDIQKAGQVAEKMHTPAVNLAGRTSVSQLASILRRCALFISNDSGPVHIASAAGVPVISIFGRAQAGLSPKRWGPLGRKDKALHKDVGCIECLAHNCVREFRCLKAITVADVLSAADLILKE